MPKRSSSPIELLEIDSNSGAVGSTKKPKIRDQYLRAVSELPPEYQGIFSNFPYFNYVQSKSMDKVLNSNNAVIISAPTGSGKTVIFELAIVRLLNRYNPLCEGSSNIKIIYIAPIKALCKERYLDWKEKFKITGLSCIELTGDSDINDYFELQEFNIILTTPEKWDALTRKWRDGNALAQSIQLVLIDEVHMIADFTRGATLEAIVSRMKAASSKMEDRISDLRFIAVSATIPNTDDIGEWLSLPEYPAHIVTIGEEYRPVKLKKIVLAYSSQDSWSEFKFDLTLNYKLNKLCQMYSNGKPTLIFCSTRKGVIQAANVLIKDGRFIRNMDHQRKLIHASSGLQEGKLKDMIADGVGYHHAGMNFNDRQIIEKIFLSGNLPVLVSTSTLAMGVNLPAHLVIIKSTKHYAQGQYEEYSEIQILQMIGRAGRPQFDESATAVIMTHEETKSKYESLVNGTKVIESSLHNHLSEHLNTEIILGTVTDISDAMKWIRSTFLYVRAMKNPKCYGIKYATEQKNIEKKLQEMCLISLNGLHKYELIRMDEYSRVKPLDLGLLMARFYMAFETMKSFSNLNGSEEVDKLLSLIAQSKDFDDIQLRVNEKKTLNHLNKSKDSAVIRFPLNGRIKTKDMKINCLMQAVFGCLNIQEPSLIQEANHILKIGHRVSKCFQEVANIKCIGYRLLLSSAVLSKCFHCKLWPDSEFISKQLEKIGAALSTALVKAKITSFRKIEETDPRDLERICNKNPPFGNQIKESAKKIPRYRVEIEQVKPYSTVSSDTYITVQLINKEIVENQQQSRSLHSCLLIVGSTENTIVLRKRLIDVHHLKSGKWTKRVMLKRQACHQSLYISLISEFYAGIDIHVSFKPFYLTGGMVPRENKLSKDSGTTDMASCIDPICPIVDTKKTCNRQRNTKSSQRKTEKFNHDKASASVADKLNDKKIDNFLCNLHQTAERTSMTEFQRSSRVSTPAITILDSPKPLSKIEEVMDEGDNTTNDTGDFDVHRESKIAPSSNSHAHLLDDDEEFDQILNIIDDAIHSGSLNSDENNIGITEGSANAYVNKFNFGDVIEEHKEITEMEKFSVPTQSNYSNSEENEIFVAESRLIQVHVDGEIKRAESCFTHMFESF